MNGKRKYPLQVLQKPYIQMHLPIISNNIIRQTKEEEQVKEQVKEIIVYELYDEKVEKDISEPQPHPHPEPQIEEPVIETLSIPVKVNEEHKFIKVDTNNTDDKKINAYGPSSFVGGSLNQPGKNKKKNTKNGKK
uniref:Uncharacterized protein n=1 Tax=viral metagenome TaxID=1070528 RepID=A0A6C0EY73_9ZZZZ